MERVFALIFGFGICAAVLWPAFGPLQADSFPFSNYPMFSIPRDRAAVNTMIGMTPGKERVPLPPDVVANGEIMQASGTVAHAIVRGPKALNALCKEVAERVATDPRLTAVDRVGIYTLWYEPVAYFTEAAEPVRRQPRAGCRVRR